MNIDGPAFQTLGSTRQYGLLNDEFSLVCGTGLGSNPPATITWTAPDGTDIVNNDRHNIESGPDIVSMNFTHTIMSDNGIWRCSVIVRSERNVLNSDSEGNLIVLGGQLEDVIGTPIQHEILLTVISKSKIHKQEN